MAIKAIILDISGVIINESAVHAREIVSKKFGLDPLKFKEYALKNLHKSYTGKLDAKDFFGGIIKENNIQASPEEMIEEWKKTREETSSWIVENKKLLETLNKKYITISLTNSTKLNDSVQIRKESYKLFKENIISCEVGFSKPEKEIYEMAITILKKYGISPNEAVFIDDTEENLKPAKTLGINAFQTEKGESIDNKLKEIGVEI